MSPDAEPIANDIWVRYGRYLPETTDVSLVILKGHLIVEEMLFAIAAARCQHPDYLEKARLTFAQLLQVTRALVKFSLPDSSWEAIALLNSLRNSLVHKLEPENLDKRLSALRVLCSNGVSEKEAAGKPFEALGVAQYCVGHIMGQLAVFQEAVAMLEDSNGRARAT